MDIFLASGNKHKKTEIQQMLTNCKVIIPADIGIEFEPEESGSTYFENAFIKAKELYQIVKKPVLADDSGLAVDFLNGAPGIYSARYGNIENGKVLSASDRNNFLLTNLKGVSNRSARFICSLIFMFDENRYYSIQETFEGSIAESPSGEHGFGYDPLFYLKEYNTTVACIPDEEKNKISHRGKALKSISILINNLE